MAIDDKTKKIWNGLKNGFKQTVDPVGDVLIPAGGTTSYAHEGWKARQEYRKGDTTYDVSQWAGRAAGVGAHIASWVAFGPLTLLGYAGVYAAGRYKAKRKEKKLLPGK